jgi:hypothetical protein
VSSNKRFPLQVWLLSCGVISPLLLLILSWIKDSGAFSDSKYYLVLLYSILIGLFFSIPVLALMYFIQVLLFRTRMSILNIKILAVLFYILGLMVTIHFVLPGAEDVIYYIYLLGTILSSLFFHVTKKTINTNSNPG